MPVEDQDTFDEVVREQVQLGRLLKRVAQWYQELQKDRLLLDGNCGFFTEITFHGWNSLEGLHVEIVTKRAETEF